MKTDLYKAFNNKEALTIRLYVRWLLRLIVLLFSVSLLAACAPKTEEEQIAAINKEIAPDGYLTNSHLYIHWPAVYTQARRNDPGGKEIVKAITLKIPMDFLGQSSLGNPTKSGKTDYSARLSPALSLHDGQITMIILSLLPGGKPYVPMPPFNKSDPPSVTQHKKEHIDSSYAVSILRNEYFALPLSKRTPAVSNKDIYSKPPRITCVVTSCEAVFGIEGRQVIIGVTKEVKADKSNSKAESDEDINSIKTYFEPNSKPMPGGNSDLPKWHNKVEAAQNILNSFVLPEDSPEVTKTFPHLN
jgi:hypothetical protein